MDWNKIKLGNKYALTHPKVIGDSLAIGLALDAKRQELQQHRESIRHIKGLYFTIDGLNLGPSEWLEDDAISTEWHLHQEEILRKKREKEERAEFNQLEAEAHTKLTAVLWELGIPYRKDYHKISILSTDLNEIQQMNAFSVMLESLVKEK